MDVRNPTDRYATTVNIKLYYYLYQLKRLRSKLMFIIENVNSFYYKNV